MLLYLLLMIGLFSRIGEPPENQNIRLPHDVRAPVVIAIDHECLSPAMFPKSRLGHLVRREIAREEWGTIWGDRAFAYDLNGDGRQEYIVLLQCSGVGNCDWGIFALGPARLIGNIPGEYLYIRKRSTEWAAITTAGHISASHYELRSYGLRKGRYLEIGNRFQQVAGMTLPPAWKFLNKVLPNCSRTKKTNPPRNR